MKRVLKVLMTCFIVLTLVCSFSVNTFAGTSSTPKLKKETWKYYTYNEKRDKYELTSKSVVKYTYKSGLNTKQLYYDYNYNMKKVNGQWKPVCTTKNALSNKLTFTYDSKKRIKTRTEHFFDNKYVTKYTYKKKDGKKYVIMEEKTRGHSKNTEIYNSKGQLISISYRSGGKLTGKETYKYNSKGDMTKHIHKDYNSGDTVTQTFKNYYTSDGALKKVEETMVPVYNWTKTTTYYNTSGKAKGLESSQTITLLSGNEAYNYTTYKFDSKGRIIQKIWKNSKYKNVAKYEY